MVLTLRPGAGGVLGELLPVAFPVTVSKFFFDTTAVRITDSNERIPPTADIEPVVSSLAPELQTVPMTPLAGGYPPWVDTTDPPVVWEASFRRKDGFVSFSSSNAKYSSYPPIRNLRTVTGMCPVGVTGGRDGGDPSALFEVFSNTLSEGASLTRAGEAARSEVRDKVSFLDMFQIVAVKTGGTIRPAVVDMLGVLLPAALPVTVSTLPLETRSALAIDSKTRMPGTAVMDPVAVRKVQEHLTARTTPSIDPLTPEEVEVGPPVEGDVFVFFSLLITGVVVFGVSVSGAVHVFTLF